MKKNTLIYRIFTIALIVTFLAGCKKDDEVKPTSEQNFASAQTTIDLLIELDAINNMAAGMEGATPSDGRISKAIVSGRLSKIQDSECGTSSYFKNEAGQSIFTFNYGTGVVCEGMSMKGIIVFVVTRLENGFIVEVPDFNGYTENGKTYQGSYSLTSTRDGSNRKEVLKYNNVSLTYEDGSQLKWTSTYTRTFTLDLSESLLNGGVRYYPSSTQTTGEISGINKKGAAFTVTTSSPIITTEECDYRKVKGTYLIQTEGYSDAVYDYGDGTCDDTATLTIDGVTKTVTIK